MGTLVRNLLDAAILLYAFTFLAAVTTGGFDLGIVSASGGAKPALVLLLLIPTRVALRGHSWLPTVWQRVGRTAADLALPARLPAAVQDAAFALLVTGVAALAIRFVANILLLADRAKPFSVSLPWPRLTETLVIFDSAWYLDIARRGYFFDAGAQSSVAFFPLYPLLIRVVATPFGATETALWAAGLAISWTAFAAALVALHRFTERVTGSRRAAARTVLYLAIFPFSFYYTHIYTESLFLLWTVLAVAAGHESRWVRAGLFGALAAATRSNGVLIALPLLLMAAAGRPALVVLARRVLALAPIPLAPVAYSAYVYALTGNALAWLSAQGQWGYSLGHMPHVHLLNALTAIETQGLYGWLLSSPTAPVDFFYTLVALLFLALVPALVRRFGLPSGAYVLAALLLPLSGNVLVGIGRYASVLFPIFMLAGTVRSTRVHHGILVVSSLFYALFLILFIGWYPLH